MRILSKGTTMREGINIEFKREWPDGIKKTMVAFANTDGGTIYLGVADDGEVVGLDDPEQCMVRAMQAAGNAIRPDVTLCTHAHAEDFEGKMIVMIDVQRGTSRPYYLAEKGVRPAGVYVRQGAMTAPASESAILAMIKESSNDVFDEERSTNQTLTFEEAGNVFAHAGIAFEEQHMRSLGFVDEHGIYTNTGLLFSDQCPFTVKAAVFQGDTKSVFKNRFEFEGSLLRQFRDALHFIDRYNATHSEIGSDMRRVDQRDYPDEAVREALLNVFVHRDYSMPAPALISIFDKRAEFANFGGLVPGMSEDDLAVGLSLQRNPHVAGVFYRLKWIEAYGTGVPKIVDSYADVDADPRFDIASNSFKVTLPSMISAPIKNNVERQKAAPCDLDYQQRTVLKLIEERGSVQRSDVEVALDITRSPAGELLARMQEEGLVRRMGKGKGTRYVAE